MSELENCNCPYHQKKRFESQNDGRCHAFMFLGDDYGDNETTFHCELPINHQGMHQESGFSFGKNYVIQWKTMTKQELGTLYEKNVAAIYEKVKLND